MPKLSTDSKVLGPLRRMAKAMENLSVAITDGRTEDVLLYNNHLVHATTSLSRVMNKILEVPSAAEQHAARTLMEDRTWPEPPEKA